MYKENTENVALNYFWFSVLLLVLFFVQLIIRSKIHVLINLAIIISFPVTKHSFAVDMKLTRQSTSRFDGSSLGAPKAMLLITFIRDIWLGHNTNCQHYFSLI